MKYHFSVVKGQSMLVSPTQHSPSLGNVTGPLCSCVRWRCWQCLSLRMARGSVPGKFMVAQAVRSVPRLQPEELRSRPVAGSAAGNRILHTFLLGKQVRCLCFKENLEITAKTLPSHFPLNSLPCVLSFLLLW